MSLFYIILGEHMNLITLKLINPNPTYDCASYLDVLNLNPNLNKVEFKYIINKSIGTNSYETKSAFTLFITKYQIEKECIFLKLCIRVLYINILISS